MGNFSKAKKITFSTYFLLFLFCAVLWGFFSFPYLGPCDISREFSVHSLNLFHCISIFLSDYTLLGIILDGFIVLHWVVCCSHSSHPPGQKPPIVSTFVLQMQQ